MSVTMAAAMASLRMPSSLALTEVCDRLVERDARGDAFVGGVRPVALPAGAEELRLDDGGHEIVHLRGGDVGGGRVVLGEAEERQEAGVEGGLVGRAGGREIVERLDVGVDAGEQMLAIVAGVEDGGQRLQRALGVGQRQRRRASPETLVVSVDRKFWAALEIWPSASCVDVSRAETSPLESTMPFSRSRSRSKETDWPVRDAERQADVGDACRSRLPSAPWSARSARAAANSASPARRRRWRRRSTSSPYLTAMRSDDSMSSTALISRAEAS